MPVNWKNWKKISLGMTKLIEQIENLPTVPYVVINCPVCLHNSKLFENQKLIIVLYLMVYAQFVVNYFVCFRGRRAYDTF